MLRKQTALRESLKREREAEEAEKRARFAADGGVCWRCRDSGLMVGALNTPCPGEPNGPHCAAGERLILQRAEANTRDILAQMDLPERRLEQALETFPRPIQPGYEDVCAFMEDWDGKTGLLLVGQMGVGKTGLLIGALKAAARQYALAGQRGQRIIFTSDGELFKQLRDGYANGLHSRHMERLQRVPLLGIDDLGTERPTDWVIDRLFLLINARYEANLPTFATTNHSLKTLRGLVGARVVDRLMECCEPLPVGGVNLRSWLRAQALGGDLRDADADGDAEAETDDDAREVGE